RDPSQQSRRHRRFRSCSRRRAIRSAAASSPVLRARAATSPGCRVRCPMLPASASNTCARSSLEAATFEMRRGEDIDPAFEALKGRAQALYVPPTPVALVNRVRINTLALAAHMPTTLAVREYVEAGGLMSYGPDWPHMWGRAANFVDKI